MRSAAASRPGVHALLLAAGGGTRFGGDKLLAPWRGEPLVRAAARIALASPAGHVVVVVGHAAAEVTTAIGPLGGDRLSIVENPDWRDGLSTSLQAGLRALPASTETVILFLGDMPLVDPDLAAELLGHLGDASAVLPTWRGRPAHPVVFSAGAIPILMTIEGDRGARDTLASLPEIRRVEISCEGATWDVDTAQDLARLAASDRR